MNIPPQVKIFFLNKVFFIKEGRVEFVNTDYISFKTMLRGSYFGEIEIIFKQKRSNTVVSSASCEILSLAKQIYENLIMKEYPQINEELKFVAKNRLERNLIAIKHLNQTVLEEKFKKKNLKRKVSFYVNCYFKVKRQRFNQSNKRIKKLG